jgi:hypothetical protein
MISHLIFLRIRNVSDKTCRENQKSFYVIHFFFGGGDCIIYSIMWKNMVEPAQVTIKYSTSKLHAG